MRRFELIDARAQLVEPGLADGEANTCCVEVRAPVSGRVLGVLHESEGVVEPGMPLLEVGDPRDLEIVVDLLSTDAVKVMLGAEVEIDGWGGPGLLHGTVRLVEPRAFTKVSALGIEEQRANVIIDLTDPPEAWAQLGHGFRIEARITVWQAPEVLQLPLSALFRQGDTWAVFVDDDGDRPTHSGRFRGTQHPPGRIARRPYRGYGRRRAPQ